MKTKYTFVVMILLSGLSATAQEQTNLFEDSSQEQAQALDGFLADGPGYHTEVNLNNGAFDSYTLISDYGIFPVEGRDMLRMRIAEIEALRAMDGYGASGAFEDEAEQTLRDPIEGVEELFDTPGQSLANIPRGFGRSFKRLGTMFRGGRGQFEDGYTKEILGQGHKKRKLAARFNVNPYSSNPVLKERLNKMAWSSWGADVLVQSAMDSILENNIGEDGYAAYDFLKTTKHFNEVMADTTPEDLLSFNRRRLRQMGVARQARKRFTKHGWYSPLHTTLIVDALEDMGHVTGVAAFLETAMGARNEQQSFSFQRSAQLMATISRDMSIHGISRHHNQVLLHTANNGLVMPIYADHLRFTPENLAAVEQIQNRFGERPLEVWVSGTVSQGYRSEMEARGIHLVDGVFNPKPFPIN